MIEEHVYQEGKQKLTALSPLNTLVVPLNEQQLSLLTFLESKTDAALLNKYYMQHIQQAQEMSECFQEDPEELQENLMIDRLAAGYSLESVFHNKNLAKSFEQENSKSIHSFWLWVSSCGTQDIKQLGGIFWILDSIKTKEQTQAFEQ